MEVIGVNEWNAFGSHCLACNWLLRASVTSVRGLLWRSLGSLSTNVSMVS